MMETILSGATALAVTAALSFPFIVGVRRPVEFDAIAEIYRILTAVIAIGVAAYYFGFFMGESSRASAMRDLGLTADDIAPPKMPNYAYLVVIAQFLYMVSLSVFRRFIVAGLVDNELHVNNRPD